MGTDTRNLPCKLTDGDILERADRIARIRAEMDDAESTLSTAKAAFKRAEEMLNGEFKLLVREIRSREEWRDVDCHEERDYHAMEVVVVRDDTGEIVERRRLTPGELQQKLKLDEQRASEAAQ